MDNMRVFIISEDGTMVNVELADLLIDTVAKRYEITNLGIGSAYNMPIYLLGELDGYEDESCVIAIDFDENDMPRPRFLIERPEIELLMNELDKQRSRDSWEVAVEVNKAIRGH